MENYTTSSGYNAVETMSGIDIYDEYGTYVCDLHGRSLDEYRDENEEIDEDALDEDIKSILEAEDFLNYQREYC